MSAAPPPGWYQHPSDPSTMRYWDGSAWTGHTAPAGTVAPAAPAPAPTPPSNKSTSSTSAVVTAVIAALVVIGVGVAGLVVWLHNSADDSADESSSTSSIVEDAGDDDLPSAETACASAADEAVRISKEQAGLGPQLLKVRAPEVIKDERADYVPPSGTGEATLLVCEGTGVWSTGDTLNVRVKLTIDADEEIWVRFAPVR